MVMRHTRGSSVPLQIAPAVLAVILASTAFVSWGLTAQASNAAGEGCGVGGACPSTFGGGPPCGFGVPTVTLHIHVLVDGSDVSLANIDFAGTNYADGASVSLCYSSSQYSISSTSIATGFAFFEWTAQNLTIGSSTASSTTVQFAFPGPSTSNYVLDLALTNSVVKNWGGYIESGSGFTQVSATFTLPSFTTSADPSYGDAMGIWLGIGGTWSTSLWQAGVEITNINSHGTPTSTNHAYPFYEEVGGSTCGTKSCLDYNLAFTGGDSITVTVSSSGGVSAFNVSDVTAGTYYAITGVSYTPASTSIEWVGEVNCGTNCLIPGGSTPFTIDSQNIDGSPANFFGALYAVVGTYPLPHSNQYLTPLTLSSPYSSFSV